MWHLISFCNDRRRGQSALSRSFEPSHEIMVLFVLRKLDLQMCTCSHPVGLDVWFLVGFFVYCHTSCMRTAKALASCGCAGSPEPSLVAYVISTIISWAGSFHFHQTKPVCCLIASLKLNSCGRVVAEFWLFVVHRLRCTGSNPAWFFFFWFDFCFMALQHILCHFGHGQLT